MRKLKKYKPTRFMAEDSHYDKSEADFAVNFIENLCHTKGTWARRKFLLMDWQEQIIRDVFGTIKPNGYRQFNMAYVEIPKKNGKSELAAAVALLLLCEGEQRGEIYSCAADKNQAKIVFDVAADMVRFSKPLSKRIKIYESQKKLEYIPTKSTYQVLSADVSNKHGFNTHGVIFDELHTQPNRKLYDVMLVESKNIIFRGAPGTGKTYLAKEIATDIISNGYFDDYTMLTDEQKQQVEFVQFHPSYDYSDFVEGLRPKTNEDGSMGFELQDGVFKKFVDKARRNYENSKKSTEVIANELSVQEAMKEFFDDVDTGNNTFKTKTGTEFTITDVDDEHIYLSIPQNASINSIRLNISEIRQMLESGREFNKLKDITEFFNINFTQQRYSYNLVIFNEIQKKKKAAKIIRQEELKKYVFIIDEINRGEISKIFGELFFAVDPGYRGVAGEVSTQYANLHADSNEKFYIPDNVYIIGTMNDIDRSVDSFDFAMRRRFRFVELRADERLEMLANLNNEEKEAKAIAKMSALNVEIAATEGLNENYQIGASYFLKLKNIDFDQLWSDYLHPLLQEYINGMYDEEGIMERFKKAYNQGKSDGVDVDESN